MTNPFNLRRSFAAAAVLLIAATGCVAAPGSGGTSRYQSGAASYYTQAGGPVAFPECAPPTAAPTAPLPPAPCCTSAVAATPPLASSTTGARMPVAASSTFSRSSSVSWDRSRPASCVASRSATRSRPTHVSTVRADFVSGAPERKPGAPSRADRSTRRSFGALQRSA